MKKAKVISIINEKGGVGKTVSTLNLGTALCRAGNKVLLIDADPQASLTVCLGQSEPDAIENTLTAIMHKEIEGQDYDYKDYVMKHEEGVHFIPANIELATLGTQLFTIMRRESILRACVDRMKSNYDYILIDSARALDMLAINSLVAADSAIIPVHPSKLSIKGMDLLLNMICRVQAAINPSLNIEGVLFTMVRENTRKARDIISEFRTAAKTALKVFDAQIPLTTKIEECSDFGVSIFSHSPGCKAAEAYKNLAEEVMSNE